MRRLCTAEELHEKLSKFSCLSDWLETPVHEIITTQHSTPPTEKENDYDMEQKP